MIAAPVFICAGWLAGLFVIIVSAAFLPAALARRFSTLIGYGASGALIAALWLSRSCGLTLVQPPDLHRPDIQAMGAASMGSHLAGVHHSALQTLLLVGLLVSPACALPVIRIVSGSTSGLARAASGLGASSTQRFRLLWFPLLRLPLLLGLGLSFSLLTLCLLLSGYRYG